MFRSIVIALVFCFVPALQAQVQVSINTTAGNILVQVDTVNAPITAKNFINLVKKCVYKKGASFYRVVRMDNQPQNDVKIEVIQGCLRHDSIIEQFKPITHETTKTTGIRHLTGVISMARLEPGSASTEIFICIGDQPELDFGGRRNPDGQGFAAFGRVVNGMEVVRKIQQMEDEGQILVQQVKITGIKILSF